MNAERKHHFRSHIVRSRSPREPVDGCYGTPHQTTTIARLSNVRKSVCITLTTASSRTQQTEQNRRVIVW